MSRVLVLALLAAFVSPAVLALPGQAPANDVVDAGTMVCAEGSDGRPAASGVANDDFLPRLRATNNGHLHLDATGSAAPGMRCHFAVQITGYSLVGFMPSGSLTNVASAPCFAGASCTATADADWMVNFVAPPSITIEIDIAFDLVVNGIVVDSGVVRIGDPSMPGFVTLP